ncbi:MerR family transcriptional regulator [Spirosoma validum]|uniref:MerR family transcriptional regulator n=1 Tax=Spirosoma validum TaxID=2771355 RepID=A0A927B3J5_9BACT|nr:MerR family transcriptional regulator [Spirosoma validum]MBD2754724.1 MerR family transcriptional regulator [Spirosoma validum]
MNSYSIKDLEQLSGIKAHTLRIWEQRYNIIAPKRTDTNIRTYDDQDLKLVLNISLLKDNGYKISEIAKFSIEDMSREVLKISARPLNYSDQIQALTLCMIDLDEEGFEKIITANIQQFGFENMVVNIIYPFMSRIGLLWVTGSIGSAQEHFITNLIRQKLVAAINEQSNKSSSAGKTFLLFLPEGEFHEISLLFANYLIRVRSNKVIYLGQNLPFDDLLFIYKTKQPDYIFTAFTSVPANHQVQPFVNRMGKCFPKSQLLLTGYQVIGQDIVLPDNAVIINQITDLTRIISR